MLYSLTIVLLLIILFSAVHFKTIGLKVDTLSFQKTLPGRGILAMLVIMHHLGQIFFTPPISDLTKPLGRVAVGAFFLMSGYGLACSYRKKGEKYLDGFMRKRVCKLFLPFLIAVVVWNIEECVLYPDYKLAEAWLRILTSDISGMLHYSWYIFAAMFFYVAFYVAYRCKVSEKKRFLIVAIFWAVWFFGCSLLRCGDWWYNAAHMFLAGILYCKAEETVKRFNVYVCIAVVYLLAVVGVTGPRPIGYNGYLYYTAFALLIICGITVFEYRSKILDFLGKISYELYIVQSLPLFAIKELGLSPYLASALCVCLDVVLAYMLHVVVARIWGAIQRRAEG